MPFLNNILRRFPASRSLSTTKGANGSGEPSFYECVEVFFDEAASLLGNVSPATLAHLKAPDSSLTFTFPIERADGKTEIVMGYRVQHSKHRMPCKGGIVGVVIGRYSLLKGSKLE